LAWEVEFSDEFGDWWNRLSADEQESVASSVGLLQEMGPNLRMPHSSGVATSRHGHMRELRIQHEGRPYRLLYAFDPRRVAFLLIGGDKTGNNRWYEQFIPRTDAIYDAHLQAMKRRGH
jgi:hypothetical protein